MKKIRLFILMLLVFLPLQIFAAKPKIVIHENIVRTDVAPYIKNDRTMVPLRVISEHLGKKVKWYEGEQKIGIFESEDSQFAQGIFLHIGSSVIQRGKGEEMTTEAPPEIKQDRTMVPIRVIAELFDEEVQWDDGTKTVFVGKVTLSPQKTKTDVYIDGIKILETPITENIDDVLLPADKVLAGKNKQIQKKKNEMAKVQSPEDMEMMISSGAFSQYQLRWDKKNEYQKEDAYLIGAHEAYLMYFPKTGEIAVDSYEEEEDGKYGQVFQRYIKAQPQPVEKDGTVYFPVKYLARAIHCTYTLDQEGNLQLNTVN